jgi:hypothetical protein
VTANPHEAALRAAALTALRDIIDIGVTEAREEALVALTDLQAIGVEQVKVRIGGPQGPHVATVSLRAPRAGIDVDPSKLLAYVKSNHPSEVVEAVTEPFRRALIARLKVDEDGTVVDPDTGIVADFASVRPAGGKPSLTLTFTTTGEAPGRAMLARAWRNGELRFLDPTQLGGAE